MQTLTLLRATRQPHVTSNEDSYIDEDLEVSLPAVLLELEYCDDIVSYYEEGD